MVLCLFIKWVIKIIENITLINFIKLLSNFILSRLTLYIDEISGEQQHEFRHNKPTTDQILDKWW